MTGKNIPLNNKFVIQLTPQYRIRIDSMNCTLMKRRTLKNNAEAVDDEVDNGYIPLGYFNSIHPEHLVKRLVVDHIITKGSKNHLKLNEFVELFNSHVNKLSKTIGKVTVYGNGYATRNVELETEVDKLKSTIRAMKGQITKLRKKK